MRQREFVRRRSPAGAASDAVPADDGMASVDAYLSGRTATHAVAARTSHYLAMRDRTRIAVDVHLPADLRAPVPAIVRQTRYFRSTDIPAWVLDLVGEDTLDPTNARMRRAFVTRGYAWVDVDVRGSGAS